MKCYEINEYAKHIMDMNGWTIHTYGGTTYGKRGPVHPHDVLGDLIHAYPDGMDFPYLDVANAILSMSCPAPLVRGAYRVAYDVNNACDAIDYNTLDEAKAAAMDMYRDWIGETVEIMHDRKTPKDERLGLWQNMLYDCTAIVEKYDPETDEYEEYWYPSEEELESIGWTEENGKRHAAGN